MKLNTPLRILLTLIVYAAVIAFERIVLAPKVVTDSYLGILMPAIGMLFASQWLVQSVWRFTWRFSVITTTLLVFLFFASEEEIERGLDLKGGASLTYELDLSTLPPGSSQEEVLLSTVRVIEDRINNLGLKDLKVDALPPRQFEVQFPGKETRDVERIKSILTQLGQLEFRIIALPPKSDTGLETREMQRRDDMGEAYPGPPVGYKWLPQRPGKTPRNEQGETVELPPGPDRLVETPEARALLEAERLRAKVEEVKADPQKDLAAAEAQLEEAEEALWNARKEHYFTGKDLAASELGLIPNPRGAGWIVLFGLKDARKIDFGNFTENNKKRLMGIVIDGKIESYPVIQEKLPGRGQISGGGLGGFTRDEAQDLVTVLRSGSLTVGITLQSEFAIGPSLGEAAIQRGMIATGLGLLAVVIFMLGVYLFPGLVAVFALLMNLLIIMGALAFAQAQLSLPGIAGGILTVGMAVDANILIFERIREERALGKSLAQAVKAGYSRAMITIVDANVTTLFSAAVLFFATEGAVKGFAVTLFVGILASMFTALFVTRAIFTFMIDRDLIGEMKMPHIFGVPKISYMKIRMPMTFISLALIVGGVLMFENTGEEKYDIGFVGGVRIVIAVDDPIRIDDVKERILGEFPDAGVISIKSEEARASDLNLAVESTSFQITIAIPEEYRPAPGAEKTETGETPEDFRDLVLAFMGEEFIDELAPVGVRPLDTTPYLVGVTRSYELAFKQDDVMRTEVMGILSATEGAGSPEVVSQDGSSFVVKVTPVQSDEVFLENFNHVLESWERPGGSELQPLSLSEPFPMTSFVDPKTAQQHRDDAIKAVLIALVFQILYIYFRFHGASFGFAAVIALVHDVLITLGAIALFGWLGLVSVKINLPIIAALLTLIGYSMNDTIVVFDRIRENFAKSKASLSEIIDLSVNQTMGRSLRTSFTTFLVVLILFLVNYGAAASVLEGFAFVLMIGVITGTYSSIFVASPMLLFLPWHYLRGRRGLFWPTVIVSLLAVIAQVFAADGSTILLVFQIAAFTYPAYFLIDLVRWLFIDDPDRAYNITLRSAGRR